MSSIGVPDVSALPLQSPERQFNLQNAEAAFTPQVVPPPQFTPEQSINELEQNRLQSTLNPPQYQPEFQQPQFQQPQFQQPQFQQPQGPDQFTPIEQQINQRMAARQRQGNGLRGLLTNFMGGFGRGMMVHSGLPTPEQQDELDATHLAAIQNARAEAQLRNMQTQNLALNMRDRVPVKLSNGQTVMVSGQEAAQYNLGQQQLEAKPDQKFSMGELIASSALEDANKGLTKPSAKTAFLIQVNHASEAQKSGDDFAQWYPKYLRDNKLTDTAANELTGKRAWTAASQQPERAARTTVMLPQPDGSLRVTEVHPGDVIPAGATTMAGREKEVSAFNKSYVDPANQVEKSYQMMDQAYREYQAAKAQGRDLPTGAQSMLALSSHLATTFGNVKGSRITKDMIQEHLGARSVSDSALVAFQRLTNGDVLSPDQWTAFHNLIGESRKLSWQGAEREAKRRNLPVDFLPPGVETGGGKATKNDPLGIL